MKIIFVGGGTAGHINPALAMASHIQEREKNSQILYVGAKNSMEERQVTAAGFEFKGITISGFSRKINFEGIKKNFKTLKNIFVAAKQSREILKDFKPDICFGTGGYVCGPFLKEAGRLGIHYVIHESNSFPGITTKLLAKKATKILLVSHAAKKYFKNKEKVVITGNPIRKGIASNILSKTDAKKALNFDEKPVILSFGGSLGAKVLNEAISVLMEKSFKYNLYNHIHAYGRGNINKTENLAEEPGFEIREYINDMPNCLVAADLVICRAGATTISELQASGTPAILIPSPNVAENHQYYNALELVNQGAVSMIEEKDLIKNPKILINEVERILGNENILKNYSKNLKNMAKPNANEKIFQILSEVLN